MRKDGAAVRDGRAILNPPEGLWDSLRHMGPGLILSAAIVGSGELIATTVLGARAGFALLWVILLGCVVKVAVQLEYGRYCISHGLPTFQGWNRVGAVRIAGIHWTVYAGVLYMISSFAGQAGVLGGASQVATYAFPILPAEAWVSAVVVLLGLLVFHGKYEPVEWIATGLNAIFIAAIFYCVVSLQWTPYAFSAGDLASGLTLRFPAESLGLAVAAFGITGVASGEIAMYPYWCMEKGYAAWTGPRDETEAWANRARGWMRVMTLDAVVSMGVYTLATCGFFILGASVLHNQAQLADGNEFILQLSAIFTDVLGEGTRAVFMLCAFTVLFSTVFSNTAAFSRLWTDFYGLCGWVDWHDERKRRRSISIMAWVFPVVCGLIYLYVQKPLLLVVFMGICNALFLVVVSYMAVIFRYRHTDPRLTPPVYYDIALWISLASIGFMAVRTVYGLFS